MFNSLERKTVRKPGFIAEILILTRNQPDAHRTLPAEVIEDLKHGNAGLSEIEGQRCV
jgi:hypothetical protein